MKKILILLLLSGVVMAAPNLIMNKDIATNAAIDPRKLSASTALNVVTYDASGYLSGGVAPGTSGNVLKSNGSIWTSAAGTNAPITITNEASGSGTSSVSVVLSNSAVIGKVLSGYVSGVGIISAADSILSAIQKLNANTALVSGSAITSLTGGVTATGPGAATATVVTNANLTGPITSVGNATSVASQTGTGSTFVMNSTPTLVTPVLGVATATTVNKVTLTPPATGSTLTIADGKTFTSNNTLTLSGTDGSTLSIGTGGTLGTAAYTPSANYWGILGNTGTSGGTNFLGNTDAQDLYFKTSGVERMRLFDTGMLGIGANTVGAYTLALSSSAARTIGVETSLTGAGNTLTITAGNSLAGGTDLNGGTLTLSGGTSTGTGTSQITFRTASPATSTGTGTNSATQKMVITGDGSLGLNTAPSSLVHINPGSARTGTPVATGQWLNVSAGTFTDTATLSSGTLAAEVFERFPAQTLAASNTVVTTTSAENFRNGGAVVAGANENITSSYGYRITGINVSGGGSVANSYGMRVDASSGALSNYAAVFMSGNTGVGMTDPQNALGVTATAALSAGIDEQIGLRSFRTAIVAGNLIGGIAARSNDTSLTAPGTVVGTIDFLADQVHTASVLDTSISFQTTSALAMSEKMRLSASGSLGIGTSTPNSTLTVNGSYQGALSASVTANTSLDINYQDVTVDASAGPVTITYPICGAPLVGRRYTVKKIDSSTNVVTLSRSASPNTFDGAVSDTLPVQYQSKTYECNSASLWALTQSYFPLSTSVIPNANIDWSILKNTDGLYTKTLSANTTFTWSNVSAAQTIVFAVTNTGSNYTLSHPATAKWPGGTAPTQTIGAKTDVYTCKSYDGSNAYCTSVQNY